MDKKSENVDIYGLWESKVVKKELNSLTSESVDSSNTGDAGLNFLRVVWCDNANIIRAKAVNLASFPENYNIGISKAQQGVPVMYDGVVPESGLGPVGEIELHPDFSSHTIIPYSKGNARVMGDMMYDGKPWDCCPRNFLKSMTVKAEEGDLEVNAAFENEFYLLKEDKTSNEIILKPADNTPFASTYAMDLHNELIGDILDCLMHQGIIVEQYYPESGSGQQEITVKYGPAMYAADNQIIFRETVRAVSAKHGFTASFLPKIFSDKAGSGSHLHLSLWRNGKNILSDKNNVHGLSEVGIQFIAGILYHLPGIMGITTPTTNSYRRMEPHSWSGAFQCWGLDNREAALRVIYDKSGVKHFEFKAMDVTSNPYLALGAVIAAGLDGVKEKLELPEPLQVDPGNLSPLEMDEKGIKNLPSSLGESLTFLENDKILLNAMGDELSKTYLAVKRAEWEALKGLSFQEEVELLYDKY